MASSFCHRFGDDVDVVGRLPVGAYDQPQDRALVPVVVELGVEAVARVPAEASVKLLGPVVVVLVNLHHVFLDFEKNTCFFNVRPD